MHRSEKKLKGYFDASLPRKKRILQARVISMINIEFILAGGRRKLIALNPFRIRFRKPTSI